MVFEAVLVTLVALAIYVFVNIQIYMADPLRKQKRDEWFEQFLEHNKDTNADPKLAWRYNVIENLFDGIH